MLSPRFATRPAILAVAISLVAVVMTLRAVIADPEQPILLMFVLPISIVALSFGMRVGIAAATMAVVAVFVWHSVTGIALGAIGFASRIASFYIAGAVLGWYADDRRRLQEESQRFIDLSRDMLCTASADGRFLAVNAAFETSLGFTRQELLSRPFIDFVHPDDRERTILETRRLASSETESVDFQNRYRTRSGDYRWLEWSAKSVPQRGLIYATARDITDRKAIERHASELAGRDPLTGLLNRRRFVEEAGIILAGLEKNDARASVLLLDLDGFKSLNDREGHAAGDQALLQVADALRQTLREIDVAARIGGDEFAIVASTPADRAAPLAGRLVAAVRERLGNAGVTASIGIAPLTNGSKLELALEAADRAMYNSKRKGGDRVTICANDPAVGFAASS